MCLWTLCLPYCPALASVWRAGSVMGISSVDAEGDARHHPAARTFQLHSIYAHAQTHPAGRGAWFIPDEREPGSFDGSQQKRNRDITTQRREREFDQSGYEIGS
ncbi:hypothetical protein B0H10DRAFT_1950477 [Mycena sp. CBHHK59/15]|nr:hypothetical protein B0H10DRAFT_1950477 [Mycena sp. CBHHK59/15]